MISIEPQHDYLVGIDSDGCAFDSMETKHKECFIPHFINHYELQGVSKYARETAEFVNLYSKFRGTNRFPAYVETLRWLQRRPAVRARGVEVTIPQGLVAWIGRETKLANPTLKRAVQETGDPDLERALAWSEAVNDAIAQMVRGVPPFPCVRECLERVQGRADVLIVSATPHDALEREWQEHDLLQYVDAVGGQELGSKQQMLENAAKYPADHVLMIGDAPGDYQAAKSNRARFYPINPGAEEASWQRLYREGIDRFFGGTFAGEYEQALLEEFHTYLPDTPPWPVEDD